MSRCSYLRTHDNKSMGNDVKRLEFWMQRLQSIWGGRGVTSVQISWHWRWPMHLTLSKTPPVESLNGWPLLTSQKPSTQTLFWRLGLKGPLLWNMLTNRKDNSMQKYVKTWDLQPLTGQITFPHRTWTSQLFHHAYKTSCIFGWLVGFVCLFFCFLDIGDVRPHQLVLDSVC